MVNRYNQIPAQVGNSEEIMAISTTERGTRDAIIRDGDLDEIPFHRHCQKTVCSAYQGGSGFTWNTIDTLSLPNLLFLDTQGRHEVWKEYFTANESENITDDLASILRLIDKVAGRKHEFSISFKDQTENIIAGPESFDPGYEQQSEHVFKLGRVVELSLSFDGNSQASLENNFKFKFNTMRVDDGQGGDTLDVKIPMHTLTVQAAGHGIKTVTGLVMNANQTIDLPHDANAIPSTYVTPSEQDDCITYNSSTGTVTIMPEPSWKIYKFQVNTSSEEETTFNLQLDMSNYVQDVWYMDSDHKVVEFEVHVTAHGTPGYRAIVGNIAGVNVVNQGDLDFSNKTYLNDQDWIESGNTNVWVFRLDNYSKSLVCSLAYVFSYGGKDGDDLVQGA